MRFQSCRVPVCTVPVAHGKQVLLLRYSAADAQRPGVMGKKKRRVLQWKGSWALIMCNKLAVGEDEQKGLSVRHRIESNSW